MEVRREISVPKVRLMVVEEIAVAMVEEIRVACADPCMWRMVSGGGAHAVKTFDRLLSCMDS